MCMCSIHSVLEVCTYNLVMNVYYLSHVRPNKVEKIVLLILPGQFFVK